MLHFLVRFMYPSVQQLKYTWRMKYRATIGYYQSTFILFSLIIRTISVKVDLDISSDDVKGMPSVINVTLTSDTNMSTVLLKLSRVEHINSNLPIYTIEDDQITKQQVQEDEFVAFYQDTNHQAVIHVVRQNVTDAPDDFIIKRGEYVDQNIRYTIEPNSRKKREANQFDNVNENYEVKRALTPLASLSDYALPPPGVHAREVRYISKKSQYGRKIDRRRRQSVSTYYIDITAFLEFSNYKLFLDQASKDQVTALKKVQEYYAFIFTGMDLVYQNFDANNIRLRIKLTKIIIFKTTASFQLTFQSNNISRVDTDKVLSSFTTFLTSTSGRDLSFPYDHAMLFVGNDLWSNNTDILGLAWLDTLCLTDGYSSSVIEDYGYYTSYLTAAHELGHSLSARHDGDKNACSYSDQFLMASSSSETNKTTKRNPWLFSMCSKSYITSCITQLLDSPSGQTCLSNTLSAVGDIPDVSSRLLGQEIPANKQCQMRFGSRSYDCQVCYQGDCVNNTFTDTWTNCTVSMCQDSLSSPHCSQTCKTTSLTPMSTTVTLSTKTSTLTTTTASVCYDNTSFTYDGLHCQGLMQRSENLCYNQPVQKSCCESCSVRATTIEGCEYGNRDTTICRTVTSCKDLTYQCCQKCSSSLAVKMEITSAILMYLIQHIIV